MRFLKTHTGRRGKYDGRPTHLPEPWPTLEGDQWVRDGDDLADVILVPVPLGARENTEGRGRPVPVAPGYDGVGDIVLER